MPKPYLIVVAGCNGAGKSTFSKTYSKELVPFDFDKRFLEIYNSLQDIDIKEQMARNTATKEFESSINEAFSNGESFCYETNFNSNPIFWVKKARKLGYRIELHFYCLHSLELAKNRVAFRTRHKGHFVDNETVFDRWKEGYKNLNLHFELFDSVLLIDNSSSKRPVKNLFVLLKQGNNKYKVKFFTWRIPTYAKRRYPKIHRIIAKSSIKGWLLTRF